MPPSCLPGSCATDLSAGRFYLHALLQRRDHGSLVLPPAYYQSVRDYNATQSGYLSSRCLWVTMLGVIFQSAGVTMIGYYTPFMILGSILMPIIAGLLTASTVDTAISKLLVLSGFYGFAGGVGFLSPSQLFRWRFQRPTPASASPSSCLPSNLVRPFSSQPRRASFENRLVNNLEQMVPSLNSTAIDSMGLSDLKTLVPPENWRMP